MNVPLSFLPAGEYRARVWHDADGGNPNELKVLDSAMNRNGALSLRIARDGGFVAVFRPAK